MTHQFRLDNNADHELSESGTTGTVYIAISNDTSVEIYFETDDRQNINLLSVGDAYQTINDIDHDYSYTLQFDYEYMAIKEIVEQYLADNPTDSDDDDDTDYHDQRTYGFTNSDFIYG